MSAPRRAGRSVRGVSCRLPRRRLPRGGPGPGRGPATPRARSRPPVSQAPAIERDRTVPSQLAETELKAGERVAGRYRIQALLGVGGMGVVYRAHDEQLGIDIALKLLRPELAAKPEAFERFRQELLLARQVSSPHVVRIHDLVRDGERWLISMDLVPGRSLEQHLDATGAVPEAQALDIARQIALGLAAAHASGIVHRDLKPANVLLRDDGRACISDFGVARSLAATRVTGTGLVVGTPDYIAPEQARGEGAGPRSDLYALGLILYEMLAGQRAFGDATPAESLARRQTAPPPRQRQLRPELAPWVERLAARLLDPNPQRRLRDAAAVVAALDARRVARAGPRAAVLVAAGAAAALAGAGWWAQDSGLALTTRSPAAAASAAVVPLDLAPLPLQAVDAADADLALAYSALIGASLLAGELAVADRRRVENALVRLGYDPRAAGAHAQRTRVETGARRLLGGELQRDGDRYRVALRVTGAGATSAPGAVTTAALSTAALAPAVRGALVELELIDARAGMGTVWPADEAALRAFGRGLAGGQSEAALDAYAKAVAREPRFVAAWWQRLQLARRMLPPAATVALAAQAREALRDVRGRDAERMQALIALIEGNPTLAAERFAPLAKADPHDHHTRLLFAEALEAAGEETLAERELAQLTTDGPQNADAWLLRGQRAIRAGEAQRAVDDYLLRARVLYTRQRDEFGRANTLNALGLGFDMLGQTRPAVDYFTQAADLRASLGDLHGAAGSRRNLAWTHTIVGDFAAADREMARARAMAAGLDDPAFQSVLLNDTGLIAEERGDFGAALPHFRQALALREAQSDTPGAGEVAQNLGFALMQTGEFAQARTYLAQAERAAAGGQDRISTIHALQLLGTLDIAEGAYDNAQTRLTRALALAREVNLAEERAVLHVELSELDRQRGRLAQAVDHGTRALALFEERGDARGRSEALLDLAATHRDRGDLAAMESALRRLDAAPPDNVELQAVRAVRRGELALARGDAAAASRHADAAQALAEQSRSLPARAQASLLRVQASIRAGDAAAARRALTQADAVLRAYPAAALLRERERAAAALDAKARVAGRAGGAP